MGAMGKSAQVPLHTWLPDAMEGPTPVSALIHAATMVTAGVFMVARLSPLFELSHDRARPSSPSSAPSPPSSRRPSAWCRTTSSASSPIRPARSSATCSWRSASAPIGAAIFHLFTHAFFKALLFLGAGSVIHAVSDEQDMRKMGGLRKLIPITYWMMVIGTLALTGVGIPLTSSAPPASSPRTRSSRAPSPAHNPVAGFAFILLVVAACFTTLLFLAADLHDLPRQAARRATRSCTMSMNRRR